MNDKNQPTLEAFARLKAERDAYADALRQIADEPTRRRGPTLLGIEFRHIAREVLNRFDDREPV